MEANEDGPVETEQAGEFSDELEARIAGHLNEEHRGFDNHYGRFYCDCGVRIQTGGHKAHRAAVKQKLRVEANRG